MAKKDKRVDAYIAQAAPFAQPILRHFRKLMHEASTDVDETIKWGFPHFDCQGMCCSMAAFKEHCAVGFWKASLMKDPHKLFTVARSEANSMGHLGKLKSLSDLPDDKILLAYMKEAVKLNVTGVNRPPRPKAADVEKKALAVPPWFVKALKQNKEASFWFEKFSPGKRNEYISWLTEAKTEETRSRRLDQAIEWIAEGKIRNWKYVKKN